MTNLPSLTQQPSESALYAPAIRIAPGRTVFVTEEGGDSAALRSRDLLAVSRPVGGVWSDATLAPLRGRVVVVLNPEPFGGSDWHARDRAAIATVAAHAVVYTPQGFQDRDAPPPSIAAVAVSLGGECFAAEVQLALQTEADEASLLAFLVQPPQPRALRPARLPVPPLRPELISEPLRPWLVDIAERIGCPVEFPVAGAIVALAALVGRKLGIRPKRQDDWTVIPNLWGAIVGRPGALKSPALAEVMKPIHRLEAEDRERHAGELAAHQADAIVRVAHNKAARDALTKAATGGKGSPEDLRRLAAEVVAHEPGPVPALKRRMVSDTTVEKLGLLLGENPGGLLLSRDELTAFLHALEKPGREADRAAYLEFWSGDGRVTYDRIGRGTTHVEGACLSILGGIQPGPLAAYVRSAGGGGDGEDGLLPRFQILVWPDDPGEWRNVDRWPDSEAKARATSIFRALDALDPDAIGAHREEGESVPFLRFAPDAQEVFDAWRGDLENGKLRGADEGRRVESHLSKYRSLMPSLALVFHLVEVVEGRAKGPVSREAAERAAAWCDVLEAHARRVYAGAVDADPEPARKLVQRIAAGDVASPFRVSEIARHCWSGLSEAREVEKAVGILEDHGWLFGVERRSGSSGGRPTIDYHVNPGVLRRGA